MTELIDRLEAAEEGSRELDAEIFCAIGGTVKEVTEVGGHKHKRWIDADGVRWQSDATLFSLSLDAALTLMPEGWDGHGFIHWPGRKDGVIINNAACTLHHNFSSGGGPRVTSYAATRALAVCAAALRAREAE